MNHYAVLGVSQDVTIEQIKIRYKELAKMYHPNSTKGHSNPQKFIEIKTSYDYLLKNHKQTTYTKPSPSPRKDNKFRGDKYYRMIDPRHIGHQFGMSMYFTEIQIDPSIVEDRDASIFCMWDMKEFVVNLPKGTKIPNTLEVSNLGDNILLRIKISIED